MAESNVIKFTNPLEDDADDAQEGTLTATEMITKARAATKIQAVWRGKEERIREKQETNYEGKKGNVGWLNRRESYNLEKEDRGQENWKYDPNLNPTEGGMRDLGNVHESWAFVFRMGVQDDKGEMKIKTTYDDADPIPLEAWQLCSRLWKHDFHIDHIFTNLGDKLIILIGLPYAFHTNEDSSIEIEDSSLEK